MLSSVFSNSIISVIEWYNNNLIENLYKRESRKYIESHSCCFLFVVVGIIIKGKEIKKCSVNLRTRIVNYIEIEYIGLYVYIDV